MGLPEDKPELAEPLLQRSEEGLETVRLAGNTDVLGPNYDLPLSLTGRPSREQLTAEVGRQWRLALPVLITVFLQVLLNLLTSVFAGHLGDLALASASLGTSVYNATGFWVLSGLAGAVDTLAGQAFGAKQYHKLGEIVQRALLLNTAACIPIGILWLYAERVLLALGQQEEIAITTAKFLGGLFVGLLGSAWRVPLVRYLAAQNVVRPVAVCAAITVLCHAAVTYVLVFPLGFGLMGAAYAFSFTQVFYLALLFGYIMCSTIRETTWSSWSWRATFSDLGLHLALALPSMVMVCLECWSYEVALFLAGLLPNPKVQLSTVNIAINIMMLAFTFGAGWSIAISVRVSNELGANSPERARLAVISAISAALLTSGIVSSGLFLSRNVVGRAFTDSKAIVRLTATLVPILCIAAAADTVQFTMSGVLRGTGKQKLGAACNLFSYYVVGIPLAILFGFYYNLGAIGMWSGLTGALLCNLCIYLFIASRVDWKAEAEKAQARTSDKAREPLV